MQNWSTESAVQQRYAAAAKLPQPALCCQVAYDAKYLAAIPAEVIEKDYGCGDPSRHLKSGETVLDLGSGAGKICFIAAQVVGPRGRVIGIDMTDAMLEVARRNAPIFARNIGYANVEFRKGRIQDLALDWDRWETELGQVPGGTSAPDPEALAQRLRREHPLIPSGSIDVLVSNCVLNLVDSGAKRQLFHEMHRVLREGGRAVISDIVSSDRVPDHLQRDPELWTGCMSGALTLEDFLARFELAGFGRTELLHRDEQPWRSVEGIDFRSVTVVAFKKGRVPGGMNFVPLRQPSGNSCGDGRCC